MPHWKRRFERSILRRSSRPRPVWRTGSRAAPQCAQRPSVCESVPWHTPLCLCVWTSRQSHGALSHAVRGVTQSCAQKSPARAGLFISVRTYRLLADCCLIHARPGLAAAEHAAKGAALHPQGIRAFQRDGGIIGAARIGIDNPAAPFLILAGPHVDQNLLAVEI